MTAQEAPRTHRLPRARTHLPFLLSAGWLFVGALGSRLAVLAATVVVARILPPSGVGRLAVVQTTITVLAGVSGLGLGITLTKRLAEVRTRSRALAARYVGTALQTTLCGGACVTGTYIATARLLADLLFRTPAAANAIQASAAGILFTALITTTQGGLIGLESFRAAAISQGLQSTLTAAGLIVGAVISGLTGALVGFSVGTALAAVASFAMLRVALNRRGIRIDRAWDARVWLHMLRFGAPAFAAFIVVTAALLVGQLLLAYRLHGYSEVGVFNVSFRWHLAVLLLPGSLASVLLPMMARLGSQGDHAQSGGLFRFNVRLAVLATAIPAGILTLLAPWILGLSGSYYSHHTAPFRLLMLAAIPSALNNVLSSASLGLGAIRAWLVSDVVLAASFFTIALLLIPSQGAGGLALAYVGGYVATDIALAAPVLRRIRPHRQD